MTEKASLLSLFGHSLWLCGSTPLRKKRPALWLWALVVYLLPAVAFAKRPTLDDAESLLRMGDYRGARELYREIAGSARDEEIKAEALYQLASVSLIEAEYVSSDSGRYRLWEEAYRAYQEYIKLRPLDGAVLMEYGKLAQKMGRFAVAEDAFSQAVYHGYAPAASRLGELRFQRYDLDGAAEAYRIAAENAPGEARFWYELGRSLFWSARWEEALDALEKAHGLDENNPDILYFYGLALRALGRTQEAIARFEWLLKRGGIERLDKVYHELALSYAEEDDSYNALYYFKQALSEAQRRKKAKLLTVLPTVLNNYAWFFCTTRDSSYRTKQYLMMAYQMAEEAVALSDRKSPEYLDTLAEIAFLLGRPEEARALMEEAIALSPHDPYFREQLTRFSKEILSPFPPEGAFPEKGFQE